MFDGLTTEKFCLAAWRQIVGIFLVVKDASLCCVYLSVEFGGQIPIVYEIKQSLI